MSTFLALSRARERISLNSLSSEQAAAVAGTGVALAGIYLIATRGGGRGTAGKALAPAPDAGANKALGEPSASGALHMTQSAPEASQPRDPAKPAPGGGHRAPGASPSVSAEVTAWAEAAAAPSRAESDSAAPSAPSALVDTACTLRDVSSLGLASRAAASRAPMTGAEAAAHVAAALASSSPSGSFSGTLFVDDSALFGRVNVGTARGGLLALLGAVDAGARAGGAPTSPLATAMVSSATLRSAGTQDAMAELVRRSLSRLQVEANPSLATDDATVAVVVHVACCERIAASPETLARAASLEHDGTVPDEDTEADEDVALITHHDDIVQFARQLGAAASGGADAVAMLASSTAQEAHDMAVVSHAVAARISAPLLHFFDAAHAEDSAALASVAPPAALSALTRRIGAAAGGPKKGTSLEDGIDQVLAELAPELGRRYGLFEYVGDSHAEVVIVAMGSMAAAAEEAVRQLQSSGAKVGVLRVRLYRPWSARHFLSVLPRSSKRLIVLDATTPHLAGAAASEAELIEGALSLDVLGSMHGAAAVRHFVGSAPPRVVSRLHTLTSATAAPSVAAERVSTMLLRELGSFAPGYQAAVAQGTGFSALEWSLEPRSGPCLAAATIKRVLRAITTPSCDGAPVGEAHGCRAHAFNAASALLPEDAGLAGVTRLSFGGSGYGGVSYVSVHDKPLAALFDVFEGLAPQAIVAINVGEDDDDSAADQGDSASAALMASLLATLSPKQRQTLARRRAALYGVNAAHLAREAGLLPLADATSPTPAQKAARARALAMEAVLVALCARRRAEAATATDRAHRQPSSAAANAVRTALTAWLRAVVAGSGGCGACAPDVDTVLHALQQRSLFARARYSAKAWARCGSPDGAAALAIAGGGTLWLGAARPAPEPVTDETDSAALSAVAAAPHEAAWRTLFPHAHGSARLLCGELAVGVGIAKEAASQGQVFPARATSFCRLTPADYHRNIFHIEIQVDKKKDGEEFKYVMGDALAVVPQNDAARVRRFLSVAYGSAAEDVGASMVALEGDAQASPSQEKIFVSVEQMLVQVLDIFGQPSRKFYKTLAETLRARAATQSNIAEAAGSELSAAITAIATAGDSSSEEGKKSFAEREAEAVCFADVLLEHTSVRDHFALLVPPNVLAALVPRVQSRLYSIASSPHVHPSTVHLLVVEEDWTTPAGEYRVGLCSHFLSQLNIAHAPKLNLPGTSGYTTPPRVHSPPKVSTPGSIASPISSLSSPTRSLAPVPIEEPTALCVGVQPSLMRLPSDASRPVVMAGTGTGMAPFRAFMQHRGAERRSTDIGPMVLYFGARFEAKEFLYEDDIRGWMREGVLTHFRPAWSRDGPKKVYIQHRIADDAALLWDLLVVRGGSFYLCGQAGSMPADVHDALLSGFASAGGLSEAEAVAKLQELKEAGRYVVEVY